jgi:ABC-type multidrug transport system permease subunit
VTLKIEYTELRSGFSLLAVQIFWFRYDTYIVLKQKKASTIIRLSMLFPSRGDWIRTSDHTPPGAYFMIYVFCICLIFSMVFIDNQLFNFCKFSSVLMVFAQNVVDLL